MYRPNTPEDSTARADSGLARRAARMPGLARAGVAALASGSIAGALFLASPALAAAGHQAATHQAAAATKYNFSTLNDQNDPTFNQLLGTSRS
jgi:hypothetical protein